MRALAATSVAVAVLLHACSPTAGEPTGGPGAPLVIYGARMAVELAPIHLAVKELYPAGRVIHNGGVANLVGEARMADVASNAETQTLRHSVNEPGMRVILTVAEGDYRIVARRSAGIASLSDLKGKRIAAYPLTSSGYFLFRMLAQAGLTSAEVTTVGGLPLDQIAPAVENRDVDAAAVWEPDSMNSLHALGDDAVVFSGQGVFRELYNLNTTADALADREKRREIVRLVRAIIDATARMRVDPTVAAEAQAMVAESGGLYTVEEVERSWPQVRFVASFPDDLLDVLVEEERWLAEQQNRPARSREQLAPLVDRSVYEEARGAGR